MEAISSSIPAELAGSQSKSNSPEENISTEAIISSENEKEKCIGGEENDKETEVIVELEEDDEESVIMEEVQTKTIDLDEDSCNEPLPPATEILIAPKDTEFVIVNAANVSLSDIGNEKDVSRYPDEDVLVKDELNETINADMSTNDVLENDPMDLLELNTRSESVSSTRSHGDVEDYGDDMSTSSAHTGSSLTQSTLNWVKEFPWLLTEDGDDPNGYCLYCDTKINIKSQKTVKQHGLSLYHKERCENYLAFREEEEKNGISTGLDEIKQEFGTNSYVQAIKLKRKSQNEAFNNFNWRKWLTDCSWLERDSTEGTVGFCKYCLVHLNVEFSYLRDRHQEGTKHKDAEKQYEQNRKPKPHDENINEPPNDKQSKKWLEILEGESNSSSNSIPLVQCKLCKTKMLKNNFVRHLNTNLHISNEKNYKDNLKTTEQISEDSESAKGPFNWKVYSKQHPWLTCDPTDSKYAYCKYCEKRVIYGNSAAKRATHEHSSQHKYNESLFKSQQRNASSKKELENSKETNQKKLKEKSDNKEDKEEENQDEDEEYHNNEERNSETSEGEDEGDEQEETEEDEEQEQGEEEEEASEEDSKGEKDDESEAESDSKKRVYRLTEEWFNQYAWCTKYNKDPKNFFFCIYCKIPLKIGSSRPKHQTSAVHISAEEIYLKRQEKKQKLTEKKQNSGHDDPYDEWAVPLKGNMYSCKYCRVRISKHYSKKSHATSKIHQINENLYKSNRIKPPREEEENNTTQTKRGTQQTNISTSKKEQTFTKVMIKVPSTLSMIKQWQKKFTWLTYKRNELRSNYGYCKICDNSLYLRSLKHVLRHVRSGRHIRLTKEKKKQKMESEQGYNLSAKIDSKRPKQELQPPSPEQTNKTNSSNSKEYQKNFNYRSTLKEMKKRYSWIEPSEKVNYAYCRFCSANVPLKILFLRNHSNSQKHRFSVKNYDGEEQQRTHIVNNDAGKSQRDVDDKSNNNNDNDDVMIVEEDNEEILISEQDENWTVKSETMDEHEELDYLLQRSFNSNQNKTNAQRNIRKSINTDESSLPKRIKRSHSFKRLNDSNTSLVASLLTTPLTLASCLGPLIQQQIQQANNQQTLLTNTSTPAQNSTVLQAESENTFDLFFKSVSETMKKLPIDIAAEGKVRIMQIICDLELQALKRQTSVHTATSTSNTSGASPNSQLASNSNNNDLSTTEQNSVSPDTVITPVHTDTDLSTPAASLTQTSIQNPPLTSTAVGQSTEVSHSTTSTSPIIGVMDRNGLQTIQLKTPLAKQIPKSASNATVTSVANPGIRCIPFKNLSQPLTPDSRMQVPLNVSSQFSSANSSPASTSKNVINFRNIQITKRLPPTSTASVNIINGVQQQQQQHQQKQLSSHSATIINKSPQRTYITNMQPQMQRWACSVNGSSSHQTPTTSSVNKISQIPPQQTSTPVQKRN